MYNIALSLGRYNPPTDGHRESLLTLARMAKERGIRAEVFVIEGEQTSQDKQKNPLSAEQRVKILKRWVPEIRFDIAASAYEVMEVLQVQNKKPAIWIAGSDRAKNYSKLLNYAGFKDSKVVELDRTAGKAAGVSATKARAAVLAEDYDTFCKMMPDDVGTDSVREVYDLVRKALLEDGAG